MSKSTFLKDTNFRRAKNCANCEFGGGDGDPFPCEKQVAAGIKNSNVDCHCVCDLWVSNDRKEREGKNGKS